MTPYLQALERRNLFSAMPGDANSDGKVDLADFSILAANFSKSSAQRGSRGISMRMESRSDGFHTARDAVQQDFDDQLFRAITITRGGTYTGNWQSTDPNLPAVKVDTTDPVTIVNSNVKGPGDLIVSDTDHTKITVRNTHGYAVNPNVYGKSAGRFSVLKSSTPR